MKEREFDALIKKRLIDHESAVPTDMWERISGKQKKPKARFASWRYVLITLLLLVGFSAGYYLMNSGDGNGNKLAVKRSESPDVGITRDKAQSENPETNVATNPSAIPEHSELNGANVFPQSRSIDNAIFNKQKKSKSKMNGKPKLNYKGVQNRARAGTANDQTSIDAIETTKSLKKVDPAGAQKKSSKKDAVVKDDSLSNTGPGGVESENDKIAIEVYASPDFPVIVLNSGNSHYEQALKTATTAKLSYTFGVRFSYLITNKLSAKIGVQYSRLNERVNFKDSLGNTVNSDNRYKTIGIPLLFCYQVAEADKLRLSVNAGLIINIATRYSGFIPSMNGEAIDIKQDEVYDENVGASVYLGMDISKRVNQRSDFFVEPRISYSLENMVNPFYAFSRKICSPGLSFGWRYRLYRDKKPQFYSSK